MYFPKSVMAAMVVLLLGAAPAWAATETVTIDNYTFTPATLIVHPGDTVIWTNKDSIPHTATALDGKSFDSGAIDPGASWKFVFTKVGHFTYRCAIHPDMRGSIDVQ
jgi:plastocyanin